MKINRTKNAARNMVMGFINKIIVLLLPFLVRTAFIYSLGAEYLGLNSLFSSILSVLSVAELGFSSAVVFSMYEPIAKNQQAKICALLNYYRSIYRVIGTAVLIGGVVLMPFLPRLINGECPDELNIYILFAMYLFNTVSSYWFIPGVGRIGKNGVDHADSPHRIVIPSCRNRQALLYLVSRGARYAVFVQVQRDSTF